MFKVDFEKAYDSVDWEFLDFVMLKIGFHEKWRRWISECLKSASISVLVNGSPTKEFGMGRGLRQGDPMSLFLFLIAAEGFNLLMRKALELGINIDQNWLEEAANILNCKIGSTPFKYLGLPIGANPRRLSTWQPVIDSVRSRLSSWKHKQLSIGGRVVILKSVLSAIPVYFLYFFQGSVRPLDEGGLGIKNLRALALLGKWVWKLKSKSEGLWLRALSNRYGVFGEGIREGGNGSSCWWKDINSVESDIQEFPNGYSVKDAYNSIMAGTQRLWYNVIRWLGCYSALHNEAMAHLDQSEGLVSSGRVVSSRVSVIWFAGMWIIWKSRNEKVFKIKDICLDKMVEEVKRYSWNWLNLKSNSIDYGIAQCPFGVLERDPDLILIKFSPFSCIWWCFVALELVSFLPEGCSL
ncbi:cysteine-rich receptor-like protein kinase [Trifolium pratense]|uniref:Cysteine-rich receptor-like protein kinase n=1 Tax=Trifolium pratense TaxID=57577 RepID=A0A2K3NES6_TRIPR|nr:cysteine-rich receptor-like protein kinase [Trifolium pratense]